MGCEWKLCIFNGKYGSYFDCFTVTANWNFDAECIIIKDLYYEDGQYTFGHLKVQVPCK